MWLVLHIVVNSIEIICVNSQRHIVVPRLCAVLSCQGKRGIPVGWLVCPPHPPISKIKCYLTIGLNQDFTILPHTVTNLNSDLVQLVWVWGRFIDDLLIDFKIISCGTLIIMMPFSAKIKKSVSLSRTYFLQRGSRSLQFHL